MQTMFSRHVYKMYENQGIKENGFMNKQPFCVSCDYSREGSFSTDHCIKCWYNYQISHVKTGFKCRANRDPDLVGVPIRNSYNSKRSKKSIAA